MALILNTLDIEKKHVLPTALTSWQEWVLNYLKQDCRGEFTSPSIVGNAYGKFVLKKLGLHSSTGSPICKELVELGLVERNKKGWYRSQPLNGI